MTLRATLPRNREIPGELVALDDKGNPIHRCSVLGKSDNARARREGNPTRDPLRQFGDTPTGTWRCGRRGPVAPASTYGVHPVVTMEPISGDALRASTRSGIWLHGGSPGRNKATAFLRPTFGCLRVADEDMGQIWVLAQTFGNPAMIEVAEK
jgi:hypothetical protein